MPVRPARTPDPPHRDGDLSVGRDGREQGEEKQKQGSDKGPVAWRCRVGSWESE